MGITQVPGFADLVLILIVVLFIFGTSKLPQIANTMGRQIVKWRKDPKDAQREIEEDEQNEEL